MRIKVLLVVAVMVLSMPARGEVLHDVFVSPEWLAARADSVVILDIGSRDGFAKGHIPGAHLVELTALVTDRGGTPNELPSIATLEGVLTAAGIGDHKRVVVYSNDPLASARAWFTLDYLGLGSRTSFLDGGFARWTAEGRPVSTELTAVEPLEFHANVRQAALATMTVMQSLVKFRKDLAPDLIMIDARSPEQFCGKEAGSGVLRAGHIPGAVNVMWTENMTNGNVPVLRSERELRDLYASLGVTARSTNVVYCRTGMQACVTYMVLRSLGFEAMLYDGSFAQWSNSPETIVTEKAGGEVSAK